MCVEALLATDDLFADAEVRWNEHSRSEVTLTTTVGIVYALSVVSYGRAVKPAAPR